MISDSQFMKEARENYANFLEDLEERVRRLPTLAQLDAEYEKQMYNARVCPDCKFVCKSQFHMDHRHRGSKNCLQRIADQQGEPFIPESQQMMICVCGYELQNRSLSKHLNGELHKNNMKKKLKRYYCVVCDKDFNKQKRPKKAFDQHCLGKRHCLRVANKTTTSSDPTIRIKKI